MDAFYLLGFSKPSLNLSPENAWLQVAGIESEASAGIRTWYKRMHRSEFEGADAERNLGNLEWLAPRVIAHDTAVSTLAKQDAFFPARFGTLFSSYDKLMEFVQLESPAILQFLLELGSDLEWGLKLFVDWKSVKQLLSDQQLANEGLELTGTHYLKIKQHQRWVEAQSKVEINNALQATMDLLRERFQRTCQREVPKNAGSLDTTLGVHRDWIGSFAFLHAPSLAKSSAQSLLIQEVAAHLRSVTSSANAITLEMTGPWPAYSFCPVLGSSARSQAA